MSSSDFYGVMSSCSTKRQSLKVYSSMQMSSCSAESREIWGKSVLMRFVPFEKLYSGSGVRLWAISLFSMICLCPHTGKKKVIYRKQKSIYLVRDMMYYALLQLIYKHFFSSRMFTFGSEKTDGLSGQNDILFLAGAHWPLWWPPVIKLVFICINSYWGQRFDPVVWHVHS